MHELLGRTAARSWSLNPGDYPGPWDGVAVDHAFKRRRVVFSALPLLAKMQRLFVRKTETAAQACSDSM